MCVQYSRWSIQYGTMLVIYGSTTCIGCRTTVKNTHKSSRRCPLLPWFEHYSYKKRCSISRNIQNNLKEKTTMEGLYCRTKSCPLVRAKKVKKKSYGFPIQILRYANHVYISLWLQCMSEALIHNIFLLVQFLHSKSSKLWLSTVMRIVVFLLSFISSKTLFCNKYYCLPSIHVVGSFCPTDSASFV